MHISKLHACILLLCTLLCFRCQTEYAFVGPSPSDEFGSVIAIYGSEALVSTASGKVYVFTLVGNSWGYKSHTNPAMLSAKSSFGKSLAMTDGIYAIGAPYSEIVLLYTYDGSNYTQIDSVSNPSVEGGVNGNDNFGFSVALSTDLLIIGCESCDYFGSSSGSVYAYRRSGNTVIKQNVSMLVANPVGAAGDNFGSSVSISLSILSGTDAVVVGAPGYSSNRGAVYYCVCGTSYCHWNCTRSFEGTTAGDAFGTSVSYSRDLLAIGSPSAKNGGSNRGKAYVYLHSGSGWSNAISLALQPPFETANNDFFGNVVSAYSNGVKRRIAVGTKQSTKAAVYEYVGAVWERTVFQTYSGAQGDEFGTSVGIFGYHYLVSAPRYSEGIHTHKGIVYFSLAPGCDNGVVEGTETCDDSNVINGDGCNSTCGIEFGWSCAGEPSVCQKCGNGRIEANETCDDGNVVSDDGCSKLCHLEQNYQCLEPAKLGEAFYFNCTWFTYVSSALTTPLSISSFIGYKSSSMHTGYEKPGECIFLVVTANNPGTYLVFSCNEHSSNGKVGRLEMQFFMSGDMSEAAIVRSDDNGEVTYNASTKTLSGKWAWNAAYTDGYAFGPVSVADFGMKMSVISVSSSLSNINVYSADDGVINFKQGSFASMSTCQFISPDKYCFEVGDGHVDPTEECDDGNSVSNDGCSLSGIIEANWTCSSAPTVCQKCVNGIVEGTETCDDNNGLNGDGCSSICTLEPGWTCAGNPSVCQNCGDGLINGTEACDDGNGANNDGCNSTCGIAPGWTCAGSPSVCQKCYNGVVEGSETCDDNNANSGDGCNSTCRVEAGWSCAGDPSVCQFCSNGIVEGNEECDDGNYLPFDGCSTTCLVEGVNVSHSGEEDQEQLFYLFNVVTAVNSHLKSMGSWTVFHGDVKNGMLDVVNCTSLFACVISYTPNANIFGENIAFMTYMLQDPLSHRNTTPSFITFTVLPVNDAPTAFNISTQGTEDVDLIIVLNGSDIESSWRNMSAVITSLPARGRLYQSSNDISRGEAIVANGTIVTNYKSIIVFSGATDEWGLPYACFGFAVSDGKLYSNDAVVEISLVSVHDLPIAMNTSICMVEDESLEIMLNGSSVEYNPIPKLSAIVVELPRNGKLFQLDGNLLGGEIIESNTSVQDGQNRVVYIPFANENGQPLDSICFVLFDGTYYSEHVGCVFVNVSSVNDAPVAHNLSSSANEDADFLIQLNGTDIDSNVSDLQYHISQLPTKGNLYQVQTNQSRGDPVVSVGANVSNRNRRIMYVPPANAFGNAYDSFKFVVSDGSEWSLPGSVNISIFAVNDPPVVTNVPKWTVLESEIQFELTASDVDSTDDELVIYIMRIPQYSNIYISKETELQPVKEGSILQDFPAPLLIQPQWSQYSLNETVTVEYTLSDGIANITSLVSFQLLCTECKASTEHKKAATNNAIDQITCYNTVGNETTCGDGYEGSCCLVCADGYYRTKDSFCRICTAGNDGETFVQIFPVVIAGILLLGCILFGSMFLTDPQFDYLLMSILTCQFMAEVGQLSSSELPEFMQNFYSNIAVITLDFSFVRPDCFVGFFNFYWLFGLTLLVLPVILAVEWWMLLLLACIRMLFYRSRAMKSKILVYYMRRFVRASLWLLTFLYYILTLRALQVFSCTTKGGDPDIFTTKSSVYLLAADPTIQCYTSAHFMTMMAGTVVLVILLLAYPLFIVLFALFGRRVLHTSVVRGTLGHLYEGYRKNLYFIAMLELTPDVGFALAAAIFWFSPTLQFLAVTPFVLLLFVLCLLFPYHKLWENILQILVLVTMLLALLLMLAYENAEHFPAEFLLGFSFLVFALSNLCLLLLVIIMTTLMVLGIFSQFKLGKIVRARAKPLLYGESLNYEAQGIEEESAEVLPMLSMTEDDDISEDVFLSSARFMKLVPLPALMPIKCLKPVGSLIPPVEMTSPSKSKLLPLLRPVSSLRPSFESPTAEIEQWRSSSPRISVLLLPTVMPVARLRPLTSTHPSDRTTFAPPSPLFPPAEESPSIISLRPRTLPSRPAELPVLMPVSALRHLPRTPQEEG
jgi:cysteine-rich repeat protein